MRAVDMRTMVLYLPFLGWFFALKACLRESFEPFSVTWILTMPFVGWFVAVFLLFAPWTTMLALSRWP